MLKYIITTSSETGIMKKLFSVIIVMILICSASFLFASRTGADFGDYAGDNDYGGGDYDVAAVDLHIVVAVDAVAHSTVHSQGAAAVEDELALALQGRLLGVAGTVVEVVLAAIG